MMTPEVKKPGDFFANFFRMVFSSPPGSDVTVTDLYADDDDDTASRMASFEDEDGGMPVADVEDNKDVSLAVAVVGSIEALEVEPSRGRAVATKVEEEKKEDDTLNALLLTPVKKVSGTSGKQGTRSSKKGKKDTPKKSRATSPAPVYFL